MARRRDAYSALKAAHTTWQGAPVARVGPFDPRCRSVRAQGKKSAHQPSLKSTDSFCV